MTSYTFNERQVTPLCEIMGRYGSDKGSINIGTSWHNYTTFYNSIFHSMREMDLRVFELGLGTNNVNIPSNMGKNGSPGASLRGWAEFFPNSSIFGADIDRDILFNTDRIHTFHCDQTDAKSIEQMWSEPQLQEGFDIIIEDGLHTFNANKCFLENSIHKLRPTGYYIIEDISHSELHLFESQMKIWKSMHNNCSFDLLRIPSTINRHDNTLLVIHKQA